MNKVFFALCLFLLSWPAIAQRQPTFQQLVESVELHKTTVRDLKTKFNQETEVVKVGPYEVDHIYMKELGIGFLAFMDGYANHILIHLKKTPLHSDKPFFKRGLTVKQVYRQLGEPIRVEYNTRLKFIRLHYPDEQFYELYLEKLITASINAENATFKSLYPHIKKMALDEFYMDLWHDNPAPRIDLMIIEE